MVRVEMGEDQLCNGVEFNAGLRQTDGGTAHTIDQDYLIVPDDRKMGVLMVCVGYGIGCSEDDDLGHRLTTPSGA